MLENRLLQLVHSISLAEIEFTCSLQVLDPLNGERSAEVERIIREFHQKYFSDDRPRMLILGINPGRLGAIAL